MGGTLFFQWQALPPPEEVFPYWYEPPAPVREESGVTVTLTEANRKHTGAGTLAYTLKNDTEQPLSFSVSMRALDYLYQGEYHRIYPSPNSEGSSGEITLEPGEELPLSLRFYTSVLSRPCLLYTSGPSGRCWADAWLFWRCLEASSRVGLPRIW